MLPVLQEYQFIYFAGALVLLQVIVEWQTCANFVVGAVCPAKHFALQSHFLLIVKRECAITPILNSARNRKEFVNFHSEYFPSGITSKLSDSLLK